MAGVSGESAPSPGPVHSKHGVPAIITTARSRPARRLCPGAPCLCHCTGLAPGFPMVTGSHLQLPPIPVLTGHAVHIPSHVWLCLVNRPPGSWDTGDADWTPVGVATANTLGSVSLPGTHSETSAGIETGAIYTPRRRNVNLGKAYFPSHASICPLITNPQGAHLCGFCV